MIHTGNITSGVSFSEAQNLHQPPSSVILQPGNFTGV